MCQAKSSLREASCPFLKLHLSSPRSSSSTCLATSSRLLSKGSIEISADDENLLKNRPEAFPGVLVPEVKTFSAASRDGCLLVTGKRESRFTPDNNFDGTGKIGVQMSPNVRMTKVRPRNIPETFRFAGKKFMGLYSISNVLYGLKQTFFNFSHTASQVSGPVAFIAVGAEVARSNIDGLYQFSALLSINLAVIFLLPLPALDGGTLALLLLEAVREGRKLPVEMEQGIMLVVFVGLFLIFKDTLSLDFIRERL
ncbi:hypothetical protein DY000_02035048 [Brassica cretica]|uniref:Peptidase M50 domain-containing protein n=1 Tax=Brassica cretica TaxID=69181 RepID=A0ABQ7DYB5_BRACR|nr:hypothetical protein DY000_02035048 [Brassica cretica]